MRKFSKMFLNGSITSIGIILVLFVSTGFGHAFADCPNNSCQIVFDDSSTGYVIGHGAKINVTDTSPGSNPQIIVQLFDQNNNPIGTPLTLNMMTANGNDVYLGSPSTGLPTYLMLNGNSNSNTSDPPNFYVQTPGYFTVSYTDKVGNKITSLPQQIVAADPPSTPYWPPYPTPSNYPQPYKTVIISCTDSHGRAGSSGDYICDTWKTATGLQIPFTYLGVTANFKWQCDPNDPNGPFEIPPKDYPCPSTQHKDVYVEVDWMQNHAPSRTALQDVINAYKNAPVTNLDGTTGIYLHIFLSAETPHKTLISGPLNGADTSDFTQIKNMYFGSASERNRDITHPATTAAALYCGISSPTQTKADQCVKNVLTAKRQVFHYALFGHDQAAAPQSSGISEVVTTSPYGASNDLFVSLGEFSYHVGSIDQQEGTFMHELGHNLGLGHGGSYSVASDPTVNCKPNYLSVMSWSRQFSDLFVSVGGRPLTYSSEGENSPSNPTTSFNIDENNNPILENPVTALHAQWTVYGLSNGAFSPPINALLPDWDNDQLIEGQQSDVETSVSNPTPINSFTFQNATIASTAPSITVTCSDTSLKVLHDWDDWHALKFDMTVTSSFSDGAGGKRG
ncbi:MAG TPA: hypothetical protein VEU72_06165 [Nitrosopumilaceae archaeon]|nr:hypothetical protein [Nitrosopumilaceae archaeon]